MIKVSDYIAKRLKDHYAVEHVFMISGGGAMHLNDSFGRYIPYFTNHHEQASAIAAEGYARAGERLAVVNVTTGPGGLNCLNGVFGQWTDSVPVLYISGQVKRSTTLEYCKSTPLRQLGDQEVDIISVVKPLTKYAVQVTDPETIKYHLDRAIFEAKNDRYGPVWLDIPIDVQATMIDEDKLEGFKMPLLPRRDLEISDVVEKLKQAKRPVIIAGHGIRLSSQVDFFHELIEKINVPVLTTFNGMDVLSTSHPNYAGHFGTIGQRAGNFVLQSADLILCLGTRNNIRQISYDWDNFAKNAYKIVVDIDEAELDKLTLLPDLAIHANLKDFIPELYKATPQIIRQEWLQWCKARQKKYSNPPEYKSVKEKINPYDFINTLTKNAAETDVIVSANATPSICLYQNGIIKKGQKIILNSGNASMGYDLPAAIGAAHTGRNVICLAGDGSIMMNIQELQTIKHYNLPIKIFVLYNKGYVSIQNTQKNYFKGRMTAADSESGVSFPDFVKVAQSFGISAARIISPDGLESKIRQVLNAKMPILCEVMLEEDYAFTPKLMSRELLDGTMVSPSLEDMYPFLSQQELESNIIE